MADIWVLTDGKPGHVNQSLGLAEALVRLRPDSAFSVVHVDRGWRMLHDSQPPKLIISAGRRTHFWNWLCKLRYGAKSVVLMKPSLPVSFFDLVLVPEHDEFARNNPRVVQTRGALNRMQPAAKVAESALVLVGGPSKHVIWDEKVVLSQIEKILTANGGIEIPIATSRRTPTGFVERLNSLGRVRVILPDDVDQSWLPDTLAVTQRVWVTSDSVSMVFEALTAGCAVSLIGLESVPNSRTQRGMQMLVESGTVDYSITFDCATTSSPLDEADRCALIVMEHDLL